MRERRPPVVEEDNVVGFEQATTDIFNLLNAEEEDLKVISIVGMPGLGKTTLATKVYNDNRVFPFSTKAWIYVSQSYSKTDLLLSILRSGSHPTTHLDEKGLVKEVRGYLSWKYLIVVDDVWEEKDWDSIKEAFPDYKNGSRILLTSRHEPVAVHADPVSKPYRLKFLTNEESWELLKIKVFGKRECPQVSQELIPVGEEIAKKCGGLPLAVVVIAGMLQTKKRKDWWETVGKSVNAFLLVMNQEQCSQVVALSYDHLPPHLKACFLYFGVFPEGYEIPAWILIRLWIAERFVQTIGDASLEVMAEDHLEDLAARNLVLVVQRSLTGRIKTCRIHDMMRDFCLNRAQEESFLFEVKENGGSNSSSYSIPTVSVVHRRLCIHSSVSKYISSKPCALRIRSFLSFAKDQVDLSKELVGYIPEEFKLLRVCHIQPISFPRFPSEIEKLVLLTHVAFSGNFSSIPAAMSNLGNLQTLIVESSSRTTRTIDIKANIMKMSHFRHLHTNKASQLPIAKKTKELHNTSSNNSVQTLTTIAPESCTEDVLSQTPFVKKIGIRGKLTTLLEGNRCSLFDNLTKLQELVTLKLLNDVFPDPPSESKLRGLPLWNKFPPKLERLTLADTFLDWKHMHVLGSLPKLEELKLKDNAFTGGNWNLLDGEYTFKKLKALQIGKTDLMFWKAEADHFPSLQHVFLKDCTKLAEIPHSLGNLTTLLTIKLHRTSSSVVTSAKHIKQQQESKGCHGLKVEIFQLDF